MAEHFPRRQRHSLSSEKALGQREEEEGGKESGRRLTEKAGDGGQERWQGGAMAEHFPRRQRHSLSSG